MIELVSGDRFGELAQLQEVAESIFGRGQRQPDWLRRKLMREGVEPELSAVAIEGGEVRGYVLLGRAPSLGRVARGAGVGVVKQARGQGLGRALIEFSSSRAREAGCVSLEFLAEPERLDWYRGQGFVIAASQLSLLAFGLGGAEPLAAGCHANVTLGPAPLWSWLPEAWERTAVEERALIELERGRVWMTREGRAWLAHRLELADDSASVPELLTALLTSLRGRLPVTTPLVLFPCGAKAAWIEALLASGFEVAQRSHVVRRSTAAQEPRAQAVIGSR